MLQDLDNGIRGGRRTYKNLKEARSYKCVFVAPAHSFLEYPMGYDPLCIK